MNKSFDVFLSHNSKDKPAVRELAEALLARGLKVCLDEWELVPGLPWRETLEGLIETTGSSAVLIGNDGLGPWQDAEMRVVISKFVERKLPVIPVLLPGASEVPRLPLFLTGFTWVDLRGGLTEEGIDRLQWGITGVPPWALYDNAKPPEDVSVIVQNITLDLIGHIRKNPEFLHSLGARQFEELIAEILASYGWRVELTGATRDGGYDIFAISKDPSGLQTSWLIECKRYRRDRKVGVGVVRALYGTRDLVIPGGMLMLATTSHFSRDVHALKESRYDLQLKDYEAILEWINAYHPNPAGRLYIKNHNLAVLTKPGADG